MTMTRFTRVVVVLGTAFLSATAPAAVAPAQAVGGDSKTAIRWLQRAAAAPERAAA